MNLISDFLTNECNFNDYNNLKENFKIKVPANFNFAYDVVDKYAQIEPEKRALVWCNDNNESKTFSFKDISEESQKAAEFLEKHNIKKGDRVMLILRRRWEFWTIFIALHRIGAIAVPATNQLNAEDIVYRTNAAGIKMIISCIDPVQSEIEKALEKSPTVETIVCVNSNESTGSNWINFAEEIKSLSGNFPREKCSTKNNDIMLTYFTSGTAGYPKMVQHNFVYPLGHITTAKCWQNVIDDGLHLSVAETGWAKSMWGKLYGQWICGTAIFVYDMNQFNPTSLMNKIAEYKITTFCAPPTVYRYLIRTDFSKYDLSSLKYCVTAGEALNSEVYNKFLEYSGMKMFEGYGQTETTILAGTFPGMEPKPGSMGKPAPGYNIEIIDENGKKCNPMQEGLIVIKLGDEKPVGLFSGYYNDEELTNEVFSDGVYYTGDTAYYDEDGYIWFVGRNDDLIKTSGYRVSPFEVESIFQQHPAVLECAVTGIPDPKRGQAVKATVVLTKGYEPTEELRKEIFAFVKERTANYKHPRLIEFVSELPKTISGKIRRVELRNKNS